MPVTLTIGSDQLAAVESLLAHIGYGESATLTAPDGRPVAVLVSLEASSPSATTESDWMLEWKSLTEQIGRAWKSDRSAMEILDEMRR